MAHVENMSIFADALKKAVSNGRAQKITNFSPITLQVAHDGPETIIAWRYELDQPVFGVVTFDIYRYQEDYPFHNHKIQYMSITDADDMYHLRTNDPNYDAFLTIKDGILTVVVHRINNTEKDSHLIIRGIPNLFAIFDESFFDHIGQ